MELKELVDALSLTSKNTVFWTRVFSGFLLAYNGFRYVSPKIMQKLSAIRQHQEHVKANPFFKEPYTETLYNASVKPDYDDLAQVDFDYIHELIAKSSGFSVDQDVKLGYLYRKGKDNY